MNNRVVITGLGIYSVLGKNLDEVRDSLFKGKSGIVYEEARKEMGFRSPLTGYLEKPVLKGVLDRRTRMSMPEQAEYAYLATAEAIKNAGIDIDFLDKNIYGLIYGNDSSFAPAVDVIDILRAKKDTAMLGSGYVFQGMTSTVTMNLSTIFKIKGANYSIAAACASGSHSIGLGVLLIKMGLQDAVICGGAQEINAWSFASFDALGAFSDRIHEPTKASRPFDRDRDGLIPSGGAATVIIESYEHAIKRGAPILAEIVGYGFSSNGEHISNSNVDGQIRSLEASLKMAGLQSKDIDYINAHATSTPLGDAAEAQAIDQVFKNKPYVSSTKSMTGHECWMAGASEIVYSMLMMQNDFIAPNINFENPDEHSAKLNIAATTINKKIDVFLSNSFGFGGTNSSLIVKRI